MSLLEIREPRSPAELDQIRRLISDFVAWARVRYADEIEYVDGYFDLGAFEAELAGLPGKYAPPKGNLLLGLCGGVAAGCVALREIGPGICEMKRLYIDPACHGQGLGRALVKRLIVDARAAGFTRMRLDTGPGQFEAHGLYRSMGFVEIEAYYELPAALRAWLVFMELDLTQAGPA